MQNMRGYSLVSQDIRKMILGGSIIVPERNLSLHEKDWPEIKIKRGFFTDSVLENRVQPNTFESSLADEVFVLDAGEEGLLRPERDESVYRTILKIPQRRRPLKSLEGGFEIKSGYNYIVKLNEKLKLSEEVPFGRSSPKSSTGRLFPLTRFLADYNPSFDEINFNHPNGMDTWLLIQPTVFNLVLHPGLTLNQLRFFTGDARLTEEELVNEFDNYNLLYRKKENGEREPLKRERWMTIDGLQLTLDALAIKTHGVFGLRARRNPDSIDMSKKDEYNAEDYFEPIISGKGKPRMGEHYLLASDEIVSVPPHLSAELRKHSREGIEGRTHDAGFVDAGFFGDLVFELSPDEREAMTIKHRTPLSKLDFFRTSEIPDKFYGTSIGSHYQGQIGPRISKHFKSFDFESAARNHEKLNRVVLVEDAKLLRGFRSVREGFEPIREDDAEKLLEALRNGLWHSRYDCENDELLLQPIPYTIVFNKKGEVLSYVRTENKKDYGDTRLLGKHSIGLGGHVTMADAPELINRCLEREVTEEEVKFLGNRTKQKLVGTLFAKDKPVDRVHQGLIYAMHTRGEVVSNEKSITHVEFVPLDEIRSGYKGYETETWSRILIPHLKSIYALSK